jgi:serine/threonine protein kinase
MTTHPGSREARRARRERVPVLSVASTLVPGYTVIGLLSRNGRLDVYDVWSERRECRCVAKVLRPDARPHRRVVRRLLREGRLLKRLAHPHLVRAYDVYRRPQPAVILETLTGETLGALIARRQRRLSATELSFLGLHVTSAVGFLHAHGLLHLDLKPENIVCERGRAVVLDLSVARRPGPSLGARGTRAYMAPEQFRRGLLTAATDVWGIGVLLYCAATGRPPFVGADPPADERRAPSVAAHRRLPAELAALIDACLRSAPAERPSLAALTTTLRRVVGPDELGVPVGVLATSEAAGAAETPAGAGR